MEYSFLAISDVAVLAVSVTLPLTLLEDNCTVGVTVRLVPCVEV